MTARSEIDDRLHEDAYAWHCALEGDDADWDAFTLWLEADPRHRVAYDDIALTDHIVGDHRDDLRLLTAAAPVEAVRERSKVHRPWLYTSVAAFAAVAAAIGIPVLLPRAAADTVYATAPGETRHLALAGATAVDLAPGTRLIAKGGDINHLELASGEAFFAVAHDPGRTLSIKAGPYAITDIGTKFTINLAAAAVLVSVSEGNVVVAQGAASAPAKVSAGQQFAGSRDGGDAEVRLIGKESIGSWRHGRLMYQNSPLSVVAADISRYTGKTIVVDPGIGERRFSGVLVIGDGSKLLANLAEFMGVSYRMEGDYFRVSAGGAG